MWRYDPVANALAIIYDDDIQVNGVLSGVDNLVTSRTGVVYVAEDGGDMQIVLLRADGSTFPVEISLSPVATEQGLLVSCAVRDIAERRKEQQRLQVILESAPDAMVVVDGERRIMLVNAQADRNNES